MYHNVRTLPISSLAFIYGTLVQIDNSFSKRIYRADRRLTYVIVITCNGISLFYKRLLRHS